MNIDLTGHQLDITPALRSYVDGKFERIERHIDNVINAHVTLDVEKLDHKAEATLNVAGKALHAEAVAHNMYAAIDSLTDKLDRLVTKHRERTLDHHRKDAQKADLHAAA